MVVGSRVARGEARILYLRLVMVAAGVGACGGQQGDVERSSPDSSPVASSAELPVTLAQPSEETAVARIRAHYARIERERPGYRCRTLGLEGFSAEGGDLEACYAGNDLRRLSAVYYGESGRGREQYYFWEDSLEFLLRRFEHYSEPLSGKVVSTDVDRFYWSGGRLIRWLNPTQQAQALSSAEAVSQDSETRETARKLVACAAQQADSVCSP